jgi:hypothetical protein
VATKKAVSERVREIGTRKRATDGKIRNELKKQALVVDRIQALPG